MIALGVLALGCIAAIVPNLFESSGDNPADPRIRRSAYPSVVLWLVASASLLALRVRPTTPAIRDFVCCLYSLGCAALLLHIAVAFHLGHAWSHRAAFEHTERVGGFGAGVYVNYFFALLWIADSIWMWVSFKRYRSRPGWMNWLVVGFMGFVIFNATVVFGSLFR